MNVDGLSSRAFGHKTTASSWEEIWEAGPYYDRISELFEEANDYVILVGWQIDSRLPLKKPRRSASGVFSLATTETLREKVIRLCEEKPYLRVYFLIWDHAYFYVIERENWQGRIWENIHPHVHFVFDNRHPFGVSHHEKIIIFDGKVALTGGIDLCDERWDTPQHLYLDPRRSRDWKQERHGPYHDIAVQVTGPICQILQEHVAMRWSTISTVPFPRVPHTDSGTRPDSGHTVYFSRTLSEVERMPKKRGMVREVEFLFRDLIQSAKKRIILEGQYYWSNVISDMLISKVHAMRGQDFELILVLAELQWIRSLTRYMMPYELSLMHKLASAARFSGVRLTIGSPYVQARSEGTTGEVLPPRPIYIHSKLLVIDDHFLSIGTANFATRALRLDTEIHMTLEAKTEAEKEHIRRFTHSLLKHWNLIPHSENKDVVLRGFLPDIDLQHLRRSLRFWSFVSWQVLFDPAVAWLFPLKSKILRWIRRRILLYAFAGISFFGAQLAVLYLSLGDKILADSASMTFAAAFLASGSLSIPVTPILILAILKLGPQLSAIIWCYSLWISGVFNYGLIRAFPVTAGWFHRTIHPQWVVRKMGVRNFASLLSILLTPRISMRAKFALQGLYCTPLPWFILGTLVIFPSVVFFTAYGCASWGELLFSEMTLNWIKDHVRELIAAIVILSVGRVSIRLWKNIN
jgi:phosphatidylserine/phosphatidylglycerophosphate/cardiolipin synthase-like enzyme